MRAQGVGSVVQLYGSSPAKRFAELGCPIVRGRGHATSSPKPCRQQNRSFARVPHRPLRKATVHLTKKLPNQVPHKRKVKRIHKRKVKFPNRAGTCRAGSPKLRTTSKPKAIPSLKPALCFTAPLSRAQPACLKQALDIKAAVTSQQNEADSISQRGCREGPLRIPGLHLRWHMPSCFAKPGCYLSLFGGVGHGAAFAARRGLPSCVVDTADHPGNDLGKSGVFQHIEACLGQVSLLGIDIPCNTWSRARRAPQWSSMPSALRGDSPQTIYGLPNLPAKDAAKVRNANRMLRGSVRCIKKCVQLKVPGYLENPLTSRIWKTKPIQALIRRRQAFTVDFDMCQYGTSWRKPTRLLIWGCQPFQLRRCSAVCGKCSRTKQAHVMLSGVSKGAFLTSQAQVYPEEFVSWLLPLLFPALRR